MLKLLKHQILFLYQLSMPVVHSEEYIQGQADYGQKYQDHTPRNGLDRIPVLRYDDEYGAQNEYQ